MKLPRWLLVSLLGFSTLGALCALVAFWLSWPERTTRRFLALIQEGEFEATNEMIVGATWSAPSRSSVELQVLRPDGFSRHTRNTFERLWQHDFREPNMKLHPRSWTDRIQGRRLFHALVFRRTQ